MEKIISLLIIFLPSILFAQNPKAVRLNQWMGMVGTTNQERLGVYVLGIKPSANLPYRAAVSRFDTNGNGFTDFFRLQSRTDTISQLSLHGIHPLVGDFNGDGYQDVAILRQSSGYGIVDTIFIYWGTAIGIDTLNPLKIPAENYGDALQPAYVGDINNDGKQDLILTAPQYPKGKYWGKAYIFLNPINKSTADYSIVGDSVTPYSGDKLGLNCAISDLNDDGYQDLIIRGEMVSDSSSYDYLNIYWGKGNDMIPDFAHPVRIQAYSPSANLNWGLACFDVNDNGISDLIWATNDLTDSSYFNHGSVVIHYGGKNFSLTPNLRLKNPGVTAFGHVIANGGDMKGNGYNDIVVGCPSADQTSGYVFVYSGGRKVDTLFDAALGVSGIHTASSFGASISSVGDVNGDGLDDIIVGSPEYPSFLPYYDSQGGWEILLGDSAIPTPVKKPYGGLPVNFELDQAYPNPFNPVTTINYQVSSNSHVTIMVYDILGREVKKLIDEDETPGKYQSTFDASGLASGVYYYRMCATTKDGTIFIQAKKVTLIK